MLPTPDTSHVSFDNVYEPAEDSYLLLDTLSSTSETAWLQHRFQNLERYHGGIRHSASPIVLEVGVGSGVVLAFVAANAEYLFGRRDVFTLGTDVNVFACRGATRTVRTAVADVSGSAAFGDVLNGNLASPMRSGIVDVLICNPPYVPTEALPSMSLHEAYNSTTQSATEVFERDSHLLALSYAGGTNGMQMADELLAQLPGLLHPIRGVAYILLCAQNKPLEVLERMHAIAGFEAELVGSSGKQAGWEKLQILRIWRTARG